MFKCLVPKWWCYFWEVRDTLGGRASWEEVGHLGCVVGLYFAILPSCSLFSFQLEIREEAFLSPVPTTMMLCPSAWSHMTSGLSSLRL